MEGVAYCIATMWEVVMGEDREASSDQSRAASQQLPLLTGGVVRSAAWRQIVADVLGVALQPVEAADASAVGAAIMGWRALGEDVQPLDGGGPVIKPNMANHTRYIELFRGFAASCREGRWM